jgi:hypothetical protein
MARAVEAAAAMLSFIGDSKEAPELEMDRCYTMRY